MATDYNDGRWHGWNGGECPVHPKTQVRAIEEIAVRWDAAAGDCDWQSFKGAFRVLKEYREPITYWAADYGGDFFGALYPTAEDAQKSCPTAKRVVPFRQFTDEAPRPLPSEADA